MQNALISSPREFAPEVLDRWGAAIGSRVAAEKLLEAGRLSDRVMDRLFDIYDVPSMTTPMDQAIGQGLSIIRSNTRQFQVVCGLIYYGSIVRGMVSHEQFSELRSMFGADELKFSVKQTDIEIGSDPNDIDADQFVSAVERVGQVCVAIWKSQLPDHIHRQLQMLGSGENTNIEAAQHGLELEVANRIVERTFDFFA